VSNRTYIINQFRGIGDILYVIPLIRKLKEEGHTVLYPTIFPELYPYFPDICFIKKEFINIDYEDHAFIKTKNVIILPLRFADTILKVSYRNCMAAKYRLMDLPANLWRTLTWKRNLKKEKELFYNVLRLEDNIKYNLINNNFLSDFSRKTDIHISNGLSNILMEKKVDYSLLDWGMVIENASNIHTVGTSLIYIIEILNVKADELHVYKRLGVENHHEYYDYILTKGWVLH